MEDCRVDVALGISLEQVPNGRAFGIIKSNFALGAGSVEKKRDDRVLADIVGNVLLGIVRAHLLLVDVFFKDEAKNTGVDFVVGS